MSGGIYVIQLGPPEQMEALVRMEETVRSLLRQVVSNTSPNQ